MFECNEDGLGSRCERDLYLFERYDFYPSNHPSGGMFGLRLLANSHLEYITSIICRKRQWAYTIGVAADSSCELILFEGLKCHPLKTMFLGNQDGYVTLWFRPSRYIVPKITSIFLPRVVVIG